VRDATDREVIRLYFFEGLSLQGIAERLDLTYDMVRDRYRRAIRQLERNLRALKP
jgi:RNA polymerase sigma factor (sigma-70 family)